MATLWNSAWFHNFAPLRKKKHPLRKRCMTHTCAKPRKNSCLGVKSNPGSFNSLLLFLTQSWYACGIKSDTR